MNSDAGKKKYSCYAYKVGKPFNTYNVEQIAQQVGCGETTIQSQVKSAAKGALHAGNLVSHGIVTCEIMGAPDVKI